MFPGSNRWDTLSSAASGNAFYTRLSPGFAPGGVLRLAFDDAPATFTTLSAVNTSIAVDESNLYLAAWMEETSPPRFPTVQRMPVSGATPTPLTHGAPTALTVDDAFVYFMDQGTLRKVPKTGGAVVDLADRQCSPMSMAVDATSIYWSCSDEGVIKKLAK